MTRGANSPLPQIAFRRRREQLADVLEKHKLDAYFFSGISDLYYLTGFYSEGFYGLVSAQGAWIFSSALMAGQIKENTSGLNVIVGKRLTLAIKELRDKYKLKRVGFDPEQVNYRLGAIFAKEGLLPHDNNPLAELRILKEDEEIDSIRQACHLTALSIDHIKTKLRPGVTELQLSKELTRFYDANHADGIAFDLIVAMGPHTALPHHMPGEARLARNQPIIFDIGAKVGGYRADLTRTLYFGRINNSFRRIFNIVQSAQKAGIERVRPGSTGGRVDAAARSVISKAGYGRYFVHSTGHGVGIDIHEPPWIRPKSPDELKPGMVLTVEPGIYLPGRFGVRIEDTMAVTPGGCEILTK